MTPKVLEELIGELPPAERARFAWAPRALEAALERLFTAPQLSDALLEEAAASFLEQNQSFLKLVQGAEAARPLMEQRGHALRQLPVRLRPPAARALATCYELAGIGLRAIEAGMLMEPGAPSGKHDSEIIAGTKAVVAVAGILHGIETGRAMEPRMEELVQVADAEAFRLAKMLAEAEIEGVSVRLGWYFEDGREAQKYRPIASWAEAETSKNDRALEMLEKWEREPEEPGEAESWEKLKRALDEDRLSDRPLFR